MVDVYLQNVLTKYASKDPELTKIAINSQKLIKNNIIKPGGAVANMAARSTEGKAILKQYKILDNARSSVRETKKALGDALRKNPSGKNINTLRADYENAQKNYASLKDNMNVLKDESPLFRERRSFKRKQREFKEQALRDAELKAKAEAEANAKTNNAENNPNRGEQADGSSDWNTYIGKAKNFVGDHPYATAIGGTIVGTQMFKSNDDKDKYASINGGNMFEYKDYVSEKQAAAQAMYDDAMYDVAVAEDLYNNAMQKVASAEYMYKQAEMLPVEATPAYAPVAGSTLGAVGGATAGYQLGKRFFNAPRAGAVIGGALGGAVGGAAGLGAAVAQTGGELVAPAEAAFNNAVQYMID